MRVWTGLRVTVCLTERQKVNTPLTWTIIYKCYLLPDPLWNINNEKCTASVIIGSVHFHCNSSDCAGFIWTQPQSMLRCRNDYCLKEWLTSSIQLNSMHICSCIQLGFSVCVCVAFKGCGTNRHHPFILFQLKFSLLPSVPSRSLAGPKDPWAGAKLCVISGNVSTGTVVEPISAFRDMILMSIFRQTLPGLLCWHRIHLGLIIYNPKAPLKHKDAWSV